MLSRFRNPAISREGIREVEALKLGATLEGIREADSSARGFPSPSALRLGMFRDGIREVDAFALGSRSPNRVSPPLVFWFPRRGI